MVMNSESRLAALLVLALASIVIGGTVDLALDQPQHWLSMHVVFETLMIVGALLMATTLWLGWWRAEHSLVEMRERLAMRQAERDAWRENAQAALEGLGHAIDVAPVIPTNINSTLRSLHRNKPGFSLSKSANSV